jgi:hypothetical protein
MSHELFYTSAPKGLQPGSNGFCTVAATRGLPVVLRDKLEALSSYRALYPPHDPNAGRNPVALMHVRVSVQGKTHSVVSRICAAGVDHTQRSNLFAHHVVLEPSEQPAGGPAWLLSQQRGFLETAWDGEVRQLAAGRRPPAGDAPPAVCRAWHSRVGDAGWAGVLAESFEKDPNRPVYLLYPLSVDPLPLLAEALALLPPERRWQVTFSTYFSSLPQGATCAWRCVPLEAPETASLRRQPGALVLDLGRDLGSARGGPFVEAARTGRAVALAAVPAGRGAESSWAPGNGENPGLSGLQPPGAGRSSAAKPATPAPVRVTGRETDDLPSLPALEPVSQPGQSGSGSFLLGLLCGMIVLAGLVAGLWFGGPLKHLATRSQHEAKETAVKERDDAIDTRNRLEKEKQAALDAKANAETDKKKAEQARAKAEQERDDALKDARSVVQKELDEAKRKRDIAEAARKKTEEAVAEAEKNAQNNGKVVSVFKEGLKGADKVLSSIDGVRKGELNESALKEALDKWLDSQANNEMNVYTALGRLKDHLAYLEREHKAKRTMVEEMIFQKRKDQATILCKDILGQTMSPTLRKQMQGFLEELKKY